MKTKPKKIGSPELLLKYFMDYAIEAKEKPFKVKDWVGKDGKEVYRLKERALTMVGFENYCFLKGYINDLKDYFSNDDGRYNDYQPNCRAIERMIEQDLAEGALAGVYNANLAARINGYAEKSETNINARVTQQITGMEIK